MADNMTEEDPILARLDREEKNNSLKTVMWALAVVAVALALALAYIWSSKSKLVSELDAEKQDLTEQLGALQSDYASLSSDY